MSRVIGFLTADDDANVPAATRRILEVQGVHLHPSDRPLLDELIEQMMPARVPEAATVEQARRNAQARTQLLEEVGALTAADVHRVAGSTAGNPRATASRWAREGRIFGVDWRGRTLYPAFQFDSLGQPRPVIRDVLELLPEALTGWARALWWTTESNALAGSRPLDVLDDLERLRAAAQAERDAWAHAAGEPVAEPVAPSGDGPSVSG